MRATLVKHILIICSLTHIAAAYAKEAAHDSTEIFSFLDNDSAYVMLPKEVYNEQDGNFSFNVYEKINLNDLQIPPCGELPVAIEKCLPSVCVEKKFYGDIYRKIVGLDDEKKNCRYAERTMNLGGLDCNVPFETNNISLIKKYIDSFNDTTRKLTETESTNWLSLVTKNCKVINEEKFTRKITLQNALLENDQRMNEFLQDVIFKNSAKPKNNTQQKSKVITFADSQVLPPYDGKAWQIPSITFYPSEAAAIQAAIDKVLPVEEQSTSESGQTSAISFFYLNSIFYASDDEWAVWVNGRKISVDSPSNYITVENIESRQVTLKWVTVNLDMLVPNWRSFVISIDNNRYEAANGKIRILIRDATIAEIIFDLGVNQTFSVNSMSIIEGKVQRNI
jgi:hypothetical protein